MATAFHVDLLTPERVLFSGEADEVQMRTDGGEIAFLARHEDFVGAIDITVVRINALGGGGDDDADEVRVALHGGFVHVEQEGGVTILAGVAELSTEIDVERARRALEAGEERRASEGAIAVPETEERTSVPAGAMLALRYPASAEAAVRRARARLDAAGALATS